MARERIEHNNATGERVVVQQTAAEMARADQRQAAEIVRRQQDNDARASLGNAPDWFRAGILATGKAAGLTVPEIEAAYRAEMDAIRAG